MNQIVPQPAFGTPLNGRQISKGIVYAVLFNGGSTYHDSSGVAGPGSYIPANVSLTWGVNRFGSYCELTSAGLNERIIWPTTGNWVPASNMTISTCYQKADSTNRNSLAMSIGYGLDGVAYAVNVHLPFSDGVVYFDFGGNGGGNRCSVGGLSFADDHWVFSVGARGQEIWQNGILRASNANNPTRSVSTVHNWTLGGSDAGFTASDLSRYNMVCMWNRQLELREIWQLNTDPYAPWRAPR